MSLLLCRCLERTMKQTIKVMIPKLKFDSFLNMHFRENDLMLVHDKNEICEPNDWILVRELPEKLSLKVKHTVEKVVYKSGHIVDPLTGKKSLGYEYVEDIEKLSRFTNEELAKR
ncbi:carrier protein-like protein [Dinothrombium tinctorium]|uniref:Carrier protein-like protein n=1 Tax=Dinothrombium tinctorium TaxID=1965070 RepID=A0A443QNZ3_9ACAR|nr:carrier protein-like protein [Dinothrombium tinctorium]